MLWLDFETRSQVDLKKHGLARYAQDASTSMICLVPFFLTIYQPTGVEIMLQTLNRVVNIFIGSALFIGSPIVNRNIWHLKDHYDWSVTTMSWVSTATLATTFIGFMIVGLTIANIFWKR